MTGIHSEFKLTFFPDDSLRSLWMTFLIGFVLTCLNAPGQQMIKTSVFIEVLTLGDDVLTKWVWVSAPGCYFPCVFTLIAV